MINWKQVLEIETYLNITYEKNRFPGNLAWRHDVNPNSRVDQSKKYSFNELLEYLRVKYPADGLIKNESFKLKPLYDACVSGLNLCPIDQILLDINEARNKYSLSAEQLKLNLLNELAEFTGSTAFFMKILREVIFELKHNSSNSTLDNKMQAVIQDRFVKFDFSSIKQVDFLALKTKSLTNNRFDSYIESCEKNNYSPPYNKDQKEDFFKDLIEFSKNEVINIINENSSALFNYKLRSNESTYATDLAKSDFGNLNIYLTLNGLFHFDHITNLKKANKFNDEIKILLSKEFSILGKESINDDFDPSYKITGNRMDSSLILGRSNEFYPLYNEFTKSYHNKVVKGDVWVHDDVHGKSFRYLNYHSKSEIVGDYEHSIPFVNVLYSYSITYLEKYRFNRTIDKNSLPEGYHLTEPDTGMNKFSNSNSFNDLDVDEMPF